MLAQYIKVGVDELGQDKLSALLRLKYNNAIADARELGAPMQIRDLFAGFQRFLYGGLVAVVNASYGRI